MTERTVQTYAEQFAALYGLILIDEADAARLPMLARRAIGTSTGFSRPTEKSFEPLTDFTNRHDEYKKETRP